MNKSYLTILIGLLSMLIAGVIFYFDPRSMLGYGLFAFGFIAVGLGILAGFAIMVANDKE
jgi:hypothetical protein